MSDALLWHRFQFGFTDHLPLPVPPADDGAGAPHRPLQASRPPAPASALHDEAARLLGADLRDQLRAWAWSPASRWSSSSAPTGRGSASFAGGVIGQTLAMEGMFAFFARVDVPRAVPLRREAASGRAATSLGGGALRSARWLSGYFIIATNAFMQHPVGHAIGAGRRLQLADFWALRAQPLGVLAVRAQHDAPRWSPASFVVAAVGAFWTLSGRHREHARALPPHRRHRRACRLAACMLFPTGDRHGKLVAEHQPATLAAMEGMFESRPARRAGDHRPARRRSNGGWRTRSSCPGMLSFLAYGSLRRTVTGLERLPAGPVARQHRAPLLRVPHHGRASGRSSSPSWRSPRSSSGGGDWRPRRPMLWVLMLAFPFPYIATTAGWMTAELGRQPWLVYGLHAHRPTAPRRRLGGQRRSSPSWLHRAVPGDRHPLPLPRGAGDRARAGLAATRRPSPPAPGSPGRAA